MSMVWAQLHEVVSLRFLALVALREVYPSGYDVSCKGTKAQSEPVLSISQGDRRNQK
jgi:hypothetical protein